MTALTLRECGELLTINQACAVLQVSRRSFSRLEQHPGFPRPVAGLPMKRFRNADLAVYLAPPRARGQRRA